MYGRLGVEFAGAGVDALEHRTNAEAVAQAGHHGLGHWPWCIARSHEMGQSRI